MGQPGLGYSKHRFSFKPKCSETNQQPSKLGQVILSKKLRIMAISNFAPCGIRTPDPTSRNKDGTNLLFNQTIPDIRKKETLRMFLGFEIFKLKLGSPSESILMRLQCTTVAFLNKIYKNNLKRRISRGTRKTLAMNSKNLRN